MKSLNILHFNSVLSNMIRYPTHTKTVGLYSENCLTEQDYEADTFLSDFKETYTAQLWPL